MACGHSLSQSARDTSSWYATSTRLRHRLGPPQTADVEDVGDVPQISNQALQLGVAFFGRAGAQDRGRMHCRRHILGPLRVDELTALGRHAEAASEQRLGRCGTETHQDFRPDELELRLEPGQTGTDLARIGLLVQATAAARHPLEVLDDVADVRLLARNTGLLQGAVEELSRRTHERFALQILLVPRLLTDQHQGRMGRPIAEYGLRGTLVERAAAAAGGGLAQTRQRAMLRKVIASAHGWFPCSRAPPFAAHGLARSAVRRSDRRRNCVACSAFVPLHFKSHHSLGLGTAAIPALVQHAGRAGFTHLGLTDLETLSGQVQFHAACRAAGVIPITGVELRSHFQAGRALGQRPGRLVLLAADARGYAALCRIVTRRRHSAGATAAPLDTLESLECSPGGAFLLTDDALLLAELVRLQGPAAVRALVVRPRPSRVEAELLAAASRWGVPTLASLDATVLEAGDTALQQLACAVQLECNGEQAARALAEDAGRPLLQRAAIDALFADLPQALREARDLAERCTLDLLALREPPRRDADQHQRELEQRCGEHLRALARCGPQGHGQYAERLSAELRSIEQLGLAEFFTCVAALIEVARQRRIPIAARGSVVGSLVGHLLGLSPIDPVAHGLYFERFVSRARRNPPDIDLDVASRRRDELIQWLIEFRGPEQSARLSSLTTFRLRSAHRAGLKALGAPPDAIERFLRRFPPDELADATLPPALRQALPEPWRRSLPLIAGLIGQPRQLALHPGGVLLCDAPLSERVPVERSTSGASVTQYDAVSLARLGCKKLDLLGSHSLDELDETLEALRRREPSPAWALDPSAIPLDDPATFSTIDRAETLGCFQLESPAMRAVLARLPIHALEDVSHALAIVRPGPASGHAKELFLARARGEARLPELDPLLRPRLQTTQGLLLYEEDILFVLSQLTGLPLETAEALRVTLSERAEDALWLARARRRFLARTGARGVAQSIAEAAWAEVLRFVRYSFNQAHASSQALLAYQLAFLKTHAPLEFGCALLNHHGGLYPRRVLGAELTRRGIPLLPPSVERSELACSISSGPEGDAVRIGLGLLKGLRSATRQRILALRKRCRPASALELLHGLQLQGRELRALVWTGACDELLGLRASDYPWVHEALLPQLERGAAGSLDSLLAAARQRLPREPAALVERYRALSRVQRELEYLELHLSEHPLRTLRGEAERQGCIPSHRLAEHVGERVRFAGIVAAARRVALVRPAVTQFLSLEDEHGLVEARLSPAAYGRLHARITTPGPFLVTALVREQQGALYLGIDELIPFHARAQPGP
jgi:DNA polymerase III subunit alpha